MRRDIVRYDDSPQPPPQRRRSPVGFILAIVMLCFFAWGWIYINQDTFESLLLNPANANGTAPTQPTQPPSVYIVDYNAIKGDLVAVAELTTFKESISNTMVAEESKKFLGQFNIPLTGVDYEYQATFVIHAGIDMNQITAGPGNTDKEVTIILPPASILAVQRNDGGFTKIDEQIFADVKAEIATYLMDETERRAVAIACESGLLDRAAAHAAQVVQQQAANLYNTRTALANGLNIGIQSGGASPVCQKP